MLSIGKDIAQWASTNGMTFDNPFFIMLALFAIAGAILGFPFLRGLFSRGKRAKAEKDMLE